MRQETNQPRFNEEFERILVETDTSVRRLSRLSHVPRRTLENWLYGHTRRPRSVEPILQVAHALHLPAQDTNSLLLAAGYPPLNRLQSLKKPPSLQLLQEWQLAPDVLLGQQSGALKSQSNLPAATSPFLGREALQEDLKKLFQKPDVRLVTISGLGGVGKTRLALETARSLEGWFDHGVYFIPLENVGGIESFWQSILNGLYIPGNGGQTANQLVEEYLQNKQILILLDNFEHLLLLTAEVGRLLSKTQRLKILVTSRHALNLRAEHQTILNGLSLETGQDSPAFHLFVQSVRRHMPDYEPAGQEVEDIIELCAQVDGLPLALELAATWRDVLSPTQILANLEKDMRKVLHSAADRPSRQQNLWELFNYSWQMLPAAEKEAAARLSVLRGSFTPWMAMAIAGCEPPELKHLIQASIVGRTSGARLMLHPLMRQFLAEQVVPSGITEEHLQKCFMQITLDWTADESGQLRKTFRAQHLQNLHSEWQHIERAWGLALKYKSYDLLESCWDLLFYFEANGSWSQGNIFFEMTRRQVPIENRRMQARIDEAQAFCAARNSEFTSATRLAQQALKTFNELGIDLNYDNAGVYARLILFSTKYALQQTAFDEEAASKMRQISGDYFEKVVNLTIKMSIGVNGYARKDYVSSAAAFQDVLAFSGPDAYIIPNVRCFLALALKAQGQETAAREQLTLALKRGRELNIYPAMVGATYELRLLEGDDPSIQQCREALETLALELGTRRTIGRIGINSSVQYLNLGAFKRARHLIRVSLGFIWHEIDTVERTRLLATIAQAYLAFGLIKSVPQVANLISPFIEEPVS